MAQMTVKPASRHIVVEREYRWSGGSDGSKIVPPDGEFISGEKD